MTRTRWLQLFLGALTAHRTGCTRRTRGTCKILMRSNLRHRKAVNQTHRLDPQKKSTGPSFLLSSNITSTLCYYPLCQGFTSDAWFEHTRVHAHTQTSQHTCEVEWINNAGIVY